MSDIMKSLAASASGMAAQSARLRLSAENIANSDTPGYQRKMTVFEQVFDDALSPGVRTGGIELDRSAFDRIFDPSNPLADETGFYDGSNVNLMVELADAREAQRSYEANLKMFEQAKSMTTSLLELLRR